MIGMIMRQNPADAMNDKRFHHFMEIALNLGDLR
jgi:hypothetical protein